ncbi:MAG TPA: branched-chain amino acid ABC transporter permease/ATP-binding protein [Mycobacteriales bacterium]|nr:branched-chain amino acid ABC transporter permease/ATP-binding protein [Mycobacteriales bacterium]HVX69060.1 branched-chain amino acid ABC transporter permease/ATP-binding protein [Mycobacteriales bacterium]
MHEILPFVVIGLTVGSVYGLAGAGLVLTYKTSGIFNFAYGSVAAMAAYLFYFLREQHHMAWPLAAVLTCAVAAPIVGIGFEQLARVLSQASTPIRVLATVGLILVVLSLGELLYPGPDRIVDPYLPTQTVRIFQVNVGWDQIIVFGIAIGSTAALYWFFRATRLGMAMRAVVDDPDLLGLMGVDPVGVRRWAWIVGTSFAALAGVLLAPSIELDALVLTMLVAQAFGAAAIGAFSNLPLTFTGGLLIGVSGSLATKYTASVPALAGVSASLPFVILFVVLVVTPRARLVVRATKPVFEVHRSWEAPWRVKAVGSSLALLALALAPIYAGVHLVAYSQVAITTILLLSLGLLVRTSGQVSLCHVAFAAVGASTMAHLTTAGFPWLLALVVSAAVAVPVACLVAIPAVRLSGVFLALATLGFGILVEQLFYTMHFMFGPNASGLPTSRPGGGIGPWHFSSQNGFYFVLLAAMVVSAVTLMAIDRGRLGRLLRAMRDSSVALETHGTTLLTARVLVFGISAFFAALAGGLTASLLQFSAASEFASFTSLTAFATVVVIVVGAPWYAVLGAALSDLVPAYWTSGHASVVLQLLFGIGAVVYAFTSRHRLELPATLRLALDRFSRPPAAVDRANGIRPDYVAAPPRQGDGLELQSLRVRYGSVTAVDDVSIRAPRGRITGLIGPNGAGKTTTFNACSGLVRPTSGQVVLNGRAITSLRPHRRARLGLGRTFQKVELFDSLTVEENVAMGREAPLAGGNPLAQLRSRRREMRAIEASCDDAMRVVGIEHLRTQQTGLLSTGQRRLVELARVLAGPFELLLLDEPSSGLDPHETEAFGAILARVVAERGTGVLLVEHDMKLVAQICQYVYVLDFGMQIFEGSVEEMQQSASVQAAYLGSREVPVES